MIGLVALASNLAYAEPTLCDSLKKEISKTTQIIKTASSPSPFESLKKINKEKGGIPDSLLDLETKLMLDRIDSYKGDLIGYKMIWDSKINNDGKTCKDSTGVNATQLANQP